MAGCYKCGSSDGDDVRLCPSCREERIKSRANVTVSGLAGTAPSPVPPQTTPDQPASEADTIAEPSSEESVDNVGLPIITKVLLAAATMASLAGIYLVGFSVHGPGLFVSKHEQVFKRCLIKYGIDPAEFAKLKEVDPSFENHEPMGAVMCEGYRETCKREPKGILCQQIADSF